MHPPKSDDELYMRIAKKFAIDLPDEKDRVIALKWLKLLQSSTEPYEKKTKIHAVELLLICLHRKLLVGPFSEPPDPDKKLTQHEWAYQPADITRLILKSEFEKMGKREFFIDLAGDLCEYVAVQEIPKFGSQFFYAFSPESIRNWERTDTGIIPRSLLEVTTIESPDDSILATSIDQSVQRRRRSQFEQQDESMGRKGFAGVSMIDPLTGQLRADFVMEMPPTGQVNTDLLQSAMQDGIVEPDDLELPPRSLSRIARPISRQKTKIIGKSGGREKPGKLVVPHIETVHVQSEKTSTKVRKLKNAPSKLQKRKAWSSFRTIEDDPDEIRKREEEAKMKAQEERRNELMQMVPGRLRKRFEMKYTKEKDEDADESNIPTTNVSQQRTSLLRPPRKSILSRSRIEESWKEKDMTHRTPKLGPTSETAQARRIVFDDHDTAIVPEEVEFERFVNSGGRVAPFVADENIKLLDESFPDVQSSFNQLQLAEKMLEAEMGDDELVGEDEPSRRDFLYKEVMMEGSRTVSGDPNEDPLEGSVRIGKRIVQLPGHEPMEQKFVEHYGDIEESLKAAQLAPHSGSSYVPANKQILGSIYEELENSMKILHDESPFEESEKEGHPVVGRIPDRTPFAQRPISLNHRDSPLENIARRESIPTRHEFKTHKINYSPIRFDFHDEIGPPPTPQSPNIVSFKETLPGYYVPASSDDRKEFAERQKQIANYHFPAALQVPDAHHSPEKRTPSPPLRKRKSVVFPPSPLLRKFAPSPVRDYSHVSPSPPPRVLATKSRGGQSRRGRTPTISTSKAAEGSRSATRRSANVSGQGKGYGRERGGAKSTFEYGPMEIKTSSEDDQGEIDGSLLKRPIGRKSPIRLPRNLTEINLDVYGK